jgi:uncharacterized protein (DUF1697 family)
MHKFVALLRALNVGGTSKAPSAALKAAAEGIGLQAVQPVLQTGNLVFQADGPPAALETRLEQAFLDVLDLKTEVMVRTDAEWSAIVAANPFPDEAGSDPSHLLVMVMKREPLAEGVKVLQARAGPERIEARGRQLYIVYPEGVGRSRLNGAAGWKKLGCQGTGRNWNTVVKLAALLAAGR